MKNKLKMMKRADGSYFTQNYKKGKNVTIGK